MTIYLTSPGTDWAGLYGPNAIITTSGQAVSGITPTFNRTVDGVTPGPSWTTFYTDYTRGTPAVAPTTDDQGNLQFWTDPGLYLMTFTLPGSTPTTVPITVQPFYPDSAWNVPAAVNSNITAVSGNVEMVYASTGPIVVTLPAPLPLAIGGYAAGGRFKVVKTDPSGYAVTVVTADSSAILGPTLGTGYSAQNSMSIYGQGGSLVFISVGVNYLLVGTNNRRVGIIEMFGGSDATVPGGSFLCNGQSLVRVDYPDLFHTIGAIYGAADGDHFNVPDMRGRSPMGAGSGPGLTARSAGTTYGAEGLYLNPAHIPNLTGTADAQVDSGHIHQLHVNGNTDDQMLYTISAVGTTILVQATQGVGYMNFSNNATAEITAGTANLSASAVNVPTLGGSQWLTPTVTPSLGTNFIIWAQ